MDLKVNDILITDSIGTKIDEGLNPINHAYQFQKTQYKVTDIHLKSVEEIYDEIPDEEANKDNEFDEHEFDNLTPEELRELQKELCEAVASQQQGFGSNALKRLFRDIQEPQVDWKTALARFSQKFINDNYTWSKQNRRVLSQGLILPGYTKSEKIEGCFVADTSGSMSTKMLTAVVSEIKAITASFQALKVKLLIGDAELTEEHDIDQNFDIATIEMKGGGGTSHRFMYQYLQDNNPQFCIAFTDGYSDIKECFQEFDTTTPVLFLVPESHADLSDYGEVIEIKADSL
jgi:predicted metal-dependent peptidase